MESVDVLDRLAQYFETLALQGDLVPDHLPVMQAGLALVEAAVHRDITEAKKEAVKAARRSGRLVTRQGDQTPAVV